MIQAGSGFIDPATGRRAYVTRIDVLNGLVQGIFGDSIALEDLPVQTPLTPGVYTNVSLAVNDRGQITNISNGSSSGGVTVVGSHLVDAQSTAGGAGTTLYTDTLAAGLCATNGGILDVTYSGLFLGTAAATVQVKVNLAGTTVFDTTAYSPVFVNQPWTVTLRAVRASASELRVTATLATNSTGKSIFQNVTTVTGLTLANAQVVELVGAGNASALLGEVTATVGSLTYTAA